MTPPKSRPINLTSSEVLGLGEGEAVELPPLDVRVVDLQQAYDRRSDFSSHLAILVCRERQLLAALQANRSLSSQVAALTESVEELERQRQVYIEHDAGCARLLDCGEQHFKIAAAIILLKLRVEELEAALKACQLQMLQSDNDSEYAKEANELANAALTPASQRGFSVVPGERER